MRRPARPAEIGDFGRPRREHHHGRFPHDRQRETVRRHRDVRPDDRQIGSIRLEHLGRVAIVGGRADAEAQTRALIGQLLRIRAHQDGVRAVGRADRDAELGRRGEINEAHPCQGEDHGDDQEQAFALEHPDGDPSRPCAKAARRVKTRSSPLCCRAVTGPRCHNRENSNMAAGARTLLTRRRRDGCAAVRLG
jgi:hypothetical protein